MCILTLERHQIKNPSKLAAFRNFNTEKISNFRTYKMRGRVIIELFFTTGKWDVLCSKDWDNESFSNFLLGLTQECRRFNP